MRAFFLTAVLTLSVLIGCANNAHTAIEINWEYRQQYVYDNDALSADQKRNTIHNWGAVLDIDPEDIEAELAEKVQDESEEESE